MKLIRLFKRYDRCLNAYMKGYIDEETKSRTLTQIFCESGYIDPVKFYMDYLAWHDSKPKQLKLF